MTRTATWTKALTTCLVCSTLIMAIAARSEEDTAVDEVAIPFVTERNQSLQKRAWGPEQAVGMPDTAGAGDFQTAWASMTPDDADEWLICEYRTAVKATAVRIHESYNPGALVKVTAFDPEGKEVLAWEGEDPTPRDKPRGISVIPVKLDFDVQKIKLYINSTSVPGWNEIDAVSLEDENGEQQWARLVTASTTYAEPNGMPTNLTSRPWGPEQAAGEPNSPAAGDATTAWASLSQDGQEEWLICEYEKPVLPTQIVVHENHAPGAVVKITVFNESDEEVVAWEGQDPTPRDKPRGVSVFPVEPEQPVDRIKIYLDSVGVADWNEIDAVGLRVGDETQWAANVEASSTYADVSTAQPTPVVVTTQQLNQFESVVMQLRNDVDQLKSQADEIKKLQAEVRELKDLLKAQLKKN